MAVATLLEMAPRPKKKKPLKKSKKYKYKSGESNIKGSVKVRDVRVTLLNPTDNFSCMALCAIPPKYRIHLEEHILSLISELMEIVPTVVADGGSNMTRLDSQICTSEVNNRKSI